MMWWIASFAAAQVTGGDVPTDLNAQLFRPSVDGDRLLWADDAGRRMDQAFTGRFLLQYVDDPLVYTDDQGEMTGLVTNVMQADLIGGYTYGRFRGGLVIPVVLFAGSDVVANQAGLGDLAVDGKVVVLDGEPYPLDLAVGLRIGLPTNTVDTALGASRVGYEATVIGSREFGPMLIAANLGLRGGPRTELENIAINDFFIARLAGGYAFAEDYGASLELSAQMPFPVSEIADELRPSLQNGAGWPLEFLLGGYGYPSRDVVLRGGLGSGLTPGIGSPDFRLVVGVGYEPRPDPIPVDTDGDGLVDDADQCPAEPEDADSWQDEDGCPDPDNDQDGILDLADQCINDPEDKDAWQDEDGCPDPNTRILVIVVDKETGQAMNIAKVAVTCGDAFKKAGSSPYETEVPPGSCSVAASAASYLRNELTVDIVNGPPTDVKIELEPQKQAKVVISRERIELKDTIRFDTGKATIKKESFGLLDEAVQILKDYPEIKRLRIEGHTDERGSDTSNLDLSKRRAASVLEYFVSKGIDTGRLHSEGYGESRPLDPGHNEAAWSKNRRTDFFIEVWEEIPTEQDAPVKPPEGGAVRPPAAPATPEAPKPPEGGAVRPAPAPEAPKPPEGGAVRPPAPEGGK